VMKLGPGGVSLQALSNFHSNKGEVTNGTARRIFRQVCGAGADGNDGSG
jgi:hypothetical protein